jgi:predicted nucleotide-binding protein
MTGDDEGRKRGDEEWKPRARQNVILELGFFVAKLGRGKVAMLYEAHVERPSDIDGVAYIALDSSGAWKRKLTHEMSAAGIPLDLERALTAYP